MVHILSLTFLLTTLAICDAQTCYPRGLCDEGFMDKTSGSGPRNWKCGEGCQGGSLTDWVCNCACIPLETCSWDPESTFDYYNVNGNTRSKRSTEADAYVYATPQTAKLIENGKISKDTINSVVNDPRFRQMLPIESVLKDCWRRCRDLLSKSSQIEQCDLISKIPVKFTTNVWCTDSMIYKKNVNIALLNLQMLQCVTQHNDIIDKLSFKPAIHVEYGGSFANFVYFQAATGIAFTTDGVQGMTTASVCGGAKLDLSIGASASVSYFWDFNNIAGDAITVEVGVDIPGTEVGIDVLLHLKPTTKALLGWGLSFGIGYGVMPVDFALSYCRTFTSNHVNSLSKVLSIGRVSGWQCDADLVGVISEQLYICCPEKNTDHYCDGPFCWFTGTECPTSPGCLDRTSELLHYYAYFPGMRWIEEGYKNKQKCWDIFNSYYGRGEGNFPVFARYVYATGECWHGDLDAKCNSFWAPVGGWVEGGIAIRFASDSGCVC